MKDQPDNETVDYIFNYHYHLFTKHERKAVSHCTAMARIHAAKRNPEDESDGYVRFFSQNQMLTTDAEALSLYKEYPELNALKLHIVNRLWQERKENLFFNNCPRCGKLARTDKAKQCRYCYHDWHS